METSLPDGVRVLMELKALGPTSRLGGVIADPSRRSGSWECAQELCTPMAGAEVHLPVVASAGHSGARDLAGRRVVPGAALIVDDESLPLRSGEQQVSVVRPAKQATRFRVGVQGSAALIAAVSVPVQAEIPPPEAEPWDAGLPEDAGTSARSAHSP